MTLALASVSTVALVLVALPGNRFHVSDGFMLQSATGRQACSSYCYHRRACRQHRATSSSIVARDSMTGRSHLASLSWISPQLLLQQHYVKHRETTLPVPLHRQRGLLVPRASGTARSGWQAAAGTASITMSAADPIGPGSIIVFESDIKGRPPTLGLVTGTSAGKKKAVYSVKPAALAAGGSSTATTTVSPRQVRYVVPGGCKYQADDLLVFEEQQEGIDEGLIEEAWDMLLEESTAAASAGLDGSGRGAPEGCGSSDDPRGMAELLFGVGQPTPLQCYQAFRLLEGREGMLYFKRRRDGTYGCRSREAVGLSRRKLELEDAAKAKKAEFVATLQAGLNEGGGYRKTPLLVEDFDKEHQEMLRGLEILAVQSVARTNFVSITSAEEALGRELLTLMGRSPSSANAFHLCVHLGLMKHHENLYAREAGVMKEFSDEAMNQAKAIIDSPPPDPEASLRRDLTQLKVYAIDSEDTNEVDDGLSVETLPDGAGERIWVHIADVSRWVPEGSPLYEEARRRRTTVYLPEGAVPMFPAELAHGVLSLRPGKECYSLSMGITLGENGEVEDVVVTPALVKASCL